MKHYQSYKHFVLILKLTIILGAMLFTSIQTTAREKGYNYPVLVKTIHTLMEKHHYNPEQLKSKEYLKTIQAMKELAKQVRNKDEFITGINQIWQNGPFSHVAVSSAHAPADQLATYLDTMEVGEGAVNLTWRDDTAILTINTMMGTDTIEFIRSAYHEITSKNAHALIIDLRNNEGGAFAIRPLVSHLISEPMDVGFFLSSGWVETNTELPTVKQLATVAAWNGWSIKDFWNDVKEQKIIKVRFQPAEPLVEVPVYILTSKRTASAAELATEALKSASRVMVIGESTAGEMLSQMPFDIAEGLHVYLPVADYYSINTGRLEGNPIIPDVMTESADALTKALQIIYQ